MPPNSMDSKTHVVTEERRSYADLEHDITDLRESVDNLTASIQGLVTAWNTAKGITTFVKWVGSISTGVAVLYALLHGGINK